MKINSSLTPFVSFVPLVLTALIFTVVAQEAGGSSPPPPKPLTVKQMISMSEVVFIGRVTRIVWKKIDLLTANSEHETGIVADIRLEVEVTDFLLGDTSRVPKGVIYMIGRSPLTHSDARKKYEKKSFIFIGRVYGPPGGGNAAPVLIAFPPSGAEPLEVGRTKEVMQEIVRLKGISGPFEDKAGVNHSK